MSRSVAVPGASPQVLGSSMLLAWLLLLRRNTDEETVTGGFAWGYASTDGAHATLPLPEALREHLDPCKTVSDALELLDELAKGDEVKLPQLADGRPLFFAHVEATKSAKVEDNLGTRVAYLGFPTANLALSLTVDDEQWPLRLDLTSQDGQLHLRASSRGRTLTHEAVEHQLDNFVSLVQVISDKPETPIRAALGALDHDLSQIWSWNAALPPKITTPIHATISALAAQIPSHPAISAWDGSLTYHDLDALSTRLAHHLLSLSLPPGSPIPLIFSKSRWTAVAVLAVLKSGLAFALTDPSQPEARLRAIAQQTRARAILASADQRGLAARIATATAAIVVPVDQSALDALPRPSAAPGPLPSPDPDAPMYVVFTSGSTGRPKGVVVSHANYASGAAPRAELVGYRAGMRVFEFASYAFDVCIDCMLCTLAAGGTVCVPSDAERVDDLTGAIRRSRARMAHMTPSVARVLGADVLGGLEVLGLGGEKVSAGDAREWSALTRVVIAYGPSECTVGCTVNGTVGAGCTNIGRGVGGVMWIVDPEDHDVLVPVGAVGELLVEGPIVGAGYLDEPEKTKEAFIEDPRWLVAGAPGARGRRGRLYKTGDLVRYDPDGSGAVVFVGRKDQQVKIRGQRVELVEIEHHLRDKLPEGVKAVAEVIAPGGDDPTLVVFLEEDARAGSAAELSSLSPEMSRSLPQIDAALADELPRYMVPTAYVPLARIPALVSGKTDRKKLHELGRSMTRAEVAGFRVVADATGPRTETEAALQRIARAILGTEVGMGDSFFVLGGDSLKAMRLVAAAREEELRLTVADVFGSPSLRDLASKARRVGAGRSAGLPPFALLGDGWDADASRRETARLCGVGEGDVEDVYPCTPLQEALMALSAKIGEAYVAQRVLELPDQRTAERLQGAFERAAGDCAILRTRIVQVPGRDLVQVVVKEKISWRTAASLDEYLRRDREEKMELGRPLVRYGLVSDGAAGKLHFVLTIHHSLYDGWSMPLVIDRVNRAYQGLPTTRPAAFRDFIHFLSSIDRAACDSFWRDQLRGATGPQFPSLPWDGYQTRADSLLETFVSLPRRPAAGTTMATVIRAAWALVASAYTACDDVVFGETLTGRNAPVAAAELIEGPMITTVPVRVGVDRGAAVAALLRDVQAAAVARIPYEHAGLQNIRRLSADALEACELRTGLVLHPNADDDEEGQDGAGPGKDHPASGLVPANDAEAAREALKFNTYAVMLVCSLTPEGFLVMASFDSKTVHKKTMEAVLRQLSLVSRQLCEESDTLVKDLGHLTVADQAEVWRVGNSCDVACAADEYEGVSGSWIVDPSDPDRLLPLGAVGELVVEVQDRDHRVARETAALATPAWMRDHGGDDRKGLLVRTGRLARFEQDAGATRLVRVDRKSVAPVNRGATRSSDGETLAAVSGKQKRLRRLWSRVLHIGEDDIGLSDSFFRLGGDSITAMKLVSEARQDGFQLTVAQVFSNRLLFDMAEALAPTSSTTPLQDGPPTAVAPYSSLDIPDIPGYVERTIKPQLSDPSWEVADVLPVRPLQDIAIRGTIQLPRFSMRYELLHFSGPIDGPGLLRACQSLVAHNEILRTVFVPAGTTFHGVVLRHLTVPTAEFDPPTGESPASFARALCNLDAHQRPAPGTPFVKFFLVHSPTAPTLVFRLSHAQYDELCLPSFLRQLAALHAGTRPDPPATPFSAFVHHTMRHNVPAGRDYWARLLAGARPAVLRPGGAEPPRRRGHFAVSAAVDVARRPRDVTAATLPTAAWALVLGRRLGRRDVLFGEVVGGRGGGWEAVAGPCWQYVPVRVVMEAGWTGMELLEAVQGQHVASSRFEGAGLPEMEGAPEWFDSVVHQDVEHVEELEVGGLACRTEAVYVHEEPLREWKVQAYHRGDEMVLEIVTFESWSQHAEELLKELVDATEKLVERPWEEIVVVSD